MSQPLLPLAAEKDASEPRGQTLKPHKLFPSLFPKPRFCAIIALLLAAAAITITLSKNFIARAMGFPPRETDLAIKRLLTMASIPLVSVIFTAFHIWLALRMTFLPVNFVGCARIKGTNLGVPGWQGIIPFKAAKMARRACDLVIPTPIRIDEILRRVEPYALIQEHRLAFESLADRALAAGIDRTVPRVYELLSADTKMAIKRSAHAASIKMCSGVFESLCADISSDPSILDIPGVVTSTLETDPALATYMFIKCGATELIFIRNIGAILGGAFGVLQLFLWTLTTTLPKDSLLMTNLMMPLFGGIVSALTNWLALWFIFRPHKPIRVRGLLLAHGLFLQRQPVVSRIYAKEVCSHVLTTRRIIQTITEGYGGAHLQGLVRAHAMRVTDIDEAKELLLRQNAPWWLTAGARVMSVVLPAGDSACNEASNGAGKDDTAFLTENLGLWESGRQAAVEVIVKGFPDLIRDFEKTIENLMDVEDTIASRMAALPAQEFEKMFHSVFIEDEWMLIALGGVLGVVLGSVQAILLGTSF